MWYTCIFYAFFHTAMMEMFSNKQTSMYALEQRELIAFILNLFIECKATLNPLKNVETFQRAGKTAASWSIAYREKKNVAFITVTHPPAMFSIQLPVHRPDQEKTVPL